jgi:hypothetical protein
MKGAILAILDVEGILVHHVAGNGSWYLHLVLAVCHSGMVLVDCCIFEADIKKNISQRLITQE